MFFYYLCIINYTKQGGGAQAHAGYPFIPPPSLKPRQLVITLTWDPKKMICHGEGAARSNLSIRGIALLRMQ
jgi:hypothetical protein